LSENQIKLLPLVKQFIREYYLVGGTAIALLLGHRRSIEFDLFKPSEIRHKNIIEKVSAFNYPVQVTRRVTEQMNLSILDVKFTFYEYPFTIEAKHKFENILRMPDLIDLAAMKAYALGRRSKWKDYVDLYFLLKHNFSVTQICFRAKEIYSQLFSEKLFRAQLAYFDDIDYTEPVEFMTHTVHDEEIKSFLIDKAIDIGL